mmetsp:Transcript_20563/g.61307  ORF Transcript_20563/g.61307 Transcript_20563/m.61307 type:complete len:325 (-) Transcript_20563:1007-1981(-)
MILWEGRDNPTQWLISTMRAVRPEPLRDLHEVHVPAPLAVGGAEAREGLDVPCRPADVEVEVSPERRVCGPRDPVALRDAPVDRHGAAVFSGEAPCHQRCRASIFKGHQKLVRVERSEEHCTPARRTCDRVAIGLRLRAGAARERHVRHVALPCEGLERGPEVLRVPRVQRNFQVVVIVDHKVRNAERHVPEQPVRHVVRGLAHLEGEPRRRVRRAAALLRDGHERCRGQLRPPRNVVRRFACLDGPRHHGLGRRAAAPPFLRYFLLETLHRAPWHLGAPRVAAAGRPLVLRQGEPEAQLAVSLANHDVVFLGVRSHRLGDRSG